MEEEVQQNDFFTVTVLLLWEKWRSSPSTARPWHKKQSSLLHRLKPGLAQLVVGLQAGGSGSTLDFFSKAAGTFPSLLLGADLWLFLS